MRNNANSSLPVQARKLLLGALATGAFLAPYTLFVSPTKAAPAPKVQICHIPPGNPANFHTIEISENALATHMEKHCDHATGQHCDFLGPCNAGCQFLCDDGNACTIDYTDDCEDVGCPGMPEAVDCSDSNACTADSCDPTTGCVNAPRPEGTDCSVDDTNPCTAPTGLCNAVGACVPIPVSDCCNTDTECQAVDQNLCTGEECIGNACMTTSNVVCETDACNVSVCIKETGTCTEDERIVCPDPECYDNGCDAETGCYSNLIEGCCISHVECDDTNDCTTDTCLGVEGCTNVPCPGASGDACNVPISCDPLTCEVTTVPQTCEDGDVCTPESCVDGMGCVPDPVVCPDDDGIACTSESCDPGLACNAGAPGLVLDGADWAGLGLQTNDINVLNACLEELIALWTAEGCLFSTIPQCSNVLAGSPACVACLQTGLSADCAVCNSVLTDAYDGPRCPTLAFPVCGAAGCKSDPDDSLCDDDGIDCTVETCDPVTGCTSLADDSLCAVGEICNSQTGCEACGNHVCTFSKTASAEGPASFIDLFFAAGAPAEVLQLPFGGEVNILCDTNTPDANGQCVCDAEFVSVEPIFLEGVGDICLKPAVCPPGDNPLPTVSRGIDCSMGSGRDVDLIQDHNIGTCVDNPGCIASCETYCGGLGYVRVPNSPACEGFCRLTGPATVCISDDEPPPTDPLHCPAGDTCDELGFTPPPYTNEGVVHGTENGGFENVCGCQCMTLGGTSSPGAGEALLSLGFSIDINFTPDAGGDPPGRVNGIPCDGDDEPDATFAPTCAPFTTTTVSTMILDANNLDANTLDSVEITPPWVSGSPFMCTDGVPTTAAGAQLRGVADFVDTRLADFASVLTINCQ